MKKLYLLIILAAYSALISGMEMDIETTFLEMQEKISNLNTEFKDKLWTYSHKVFKQYPCIEPLINVATHMSQTKTWQINEDTMGHYAYDKWLTDKTSKNARVALLFGCLKHYAQTIEITEEPLPTFEDTHKEKSIKTIQNPLAKALDFECDNNFTEIQYKLDKKKIIRQFPAFLTLKQSIKKLKKRDKPGAFLNYIYSEHTNTLEENAYQKFTQDMLEITFVNKSRYLININDALPNYSQRITTYTYDLLQLIEFLSPPFFSNISHHSKDQWYLLYFFIQKYINQKTTKITPTIEQITRYNQWPSNFIMPHSFDYDLFNNDIYALKEFNKLINNIAALNKTNDYTVEQYAQALYNQTK